MPGQEPEPQARRRLLEAILAYPGLRVAELARLLDITPSLVDYHAGTLLDTELVVEATFEGHRRFYPLPVPGAPSVADAEGVAVLRDPVRLHVALRLARADGPLTHTALRAPVAVAKSTLSFHLARLVEVGLVDKDEKGAYRPRDRTRLVRLLVAHPPLGEHLDAHLADWLALYREAARLP